MAGTVTVNGVSAVQLFLIIFEVRRLQDKYTVLKTSYFVCHFQLSDTQLIVDTEMETANLVTNLQQTITLVTRNCNFDKQFAG